jgi:secreted PhoX family phosphatase
MCAPSAQHQHRAEFRRDRRPTAQPALFACGQRLPRRCGCLADIPGWLHSSGTSSTVPSEGLEFDPIAPVPEKVDAITVPYGYRWTPILRWGDPLFADSPDFAPGSPNAAAQALQFGYNNDFLAIMDIDDSGRSALLCCNHEFTNRAIMFPPSESEIQEQEALNATMAAQGLSVVELERPAARQPWRYLRGAARNRRITAHTPFTLTGPAAGE